MTELTESKEISNLWPEVIKDFDIESFKQEVLSKQSFEEQIEVFDKSFNLFRNYYLCVTKADRKVLFSIYCGCSGCREKGERYSSEKEQIFNQFRARKYVALQKELDAIPNFVERVYHGYKYFGEGSGPYSYVPYEDAPEEFRASTLPKNGQEKEVWNIHVVDNLNETYFYNEDSSYYKKSYNYLARQINNQLRFAIYPQEVLAREIERIRQTYERPDLNIDAVSGLKGISTHERVGVEEFRNLVSGKPFDIFNGFSSLTFALVRLEQCQIVQYLRYLEEVRKYLSNTGTLPNSIMNNPLPPAYDPIITKTIRTLSRGYTSKSDYNLIDDQVKELSKEQAYTFLSRIAEGLKYVLTEHIKNCQHPPGQCTHQQAIERAHNSIANRLLDFIPVEPEAKATDSSGILSGLNNSQTVLLIYYTLKLFGLEPRKNMDVSQAAKVAHLLTGKELTTVNNSDLYQKFKQVPNFKQDKGLIEDLEIVKLRFKKAQLNEAVKMIDNEIETAKMERLNKQ
ncbi:hypothetical protein [Spirosoma luteum]|uniref:hypothetical protein n=1 Tax=Spirosoma luteum TaxID=431553 RepID=UPI0003A59963|nr:hypothetical protein [Spirosoma luteum]